MVDIIAQRERRQISITWGMLGRVYIVLIKHHCPLTLCLKTGLNMNPGTLCFGYALVGWLNIPKWKPCSANIQQNICCRNLSIKNALQYLANLRIMQQHRQE